MELTYLVKKQVVEGEKRMYFRFRETRFYGGSATADVSGCNLRCAYCWSWSYITKPRGRFYTPEEVAEKLNTLRGVARVTGGEPLISPEHTVKVIEYVEKPFILETNGLLLDRPVVRRLESLGEVRVRLSLKGYDNQSFERITGARGEYFEKQIDVAILLTNTGIPSVLTFNVGLFGIEGLIKLVMLLKERGVDLPIELEPLVCYAGVRERLRRIGWERFSCTSSSYSSSTRSTRSGEPLQRYMR